MKTGKRIVSILLVALMLLTVAQLMISASAADGKKDAFSVGQAASPARYTVTWSNGSKRITVHYGYLNGDTSTFSTIRFVEFDTSVFSHGEPNINTSNAPNYLIYDVMGYDFFHSYRTTSSGNSSQVQPLISLKSGDLLYYNSDSTGTMSSGDHIYMVYKPKAEPSNGGSPLSTEKLGDVIVLLDASGSMKRDLAGNTLSDSQSSQSCLARAKAAITGLSNDLLSDERVNQSGEKLFRMSLITYSNTAQIVQGFTDDKAVFNAAVDGVTADGGTNWEQALQTANEMPVDPNCATYVILVGGPDPTWRMTRYNVSDSSLRSQNDVYTAKDGLYYREYNVFGHGSCDDQNRNYMAALQQAQSIVDHGKQFCSIGISNDVTNLNLFMEESGAGLERSFIFENEDELLEIILNPTAGAEVVNTKRIDFDILEDEEKNEYVHGYVDDIYFNSKWFSQDAKQYNHELCQFCSQFSMLGYAKKDQLVDALEEVGFDVDNDYVNKQAKRDEVNYFIASKEITVNNEPKTLIFAGFIGSYHKQWNSNFDPYGLDREKSYAGNDEKGIVHLGFADAREFVYQRLQAFIAEKGIERSDIKLLLTGHSRGAATANLLAGKLIGNENNRIVDSGNLYAYTFATPRVAQKKGNYSDMLDEKYGCIFNIVNPEDFVTKVLPYDWGFQRFGNGINGSTFVLPSKTNEAENYSAFKKAMQRYYGKFTSDAEYSSFEEGEETVYNLVNVFTSKVSDLDDFYYKRFTFETNVYSYLSSPFIFFQSYICPFVNGTKKDFCPSTERMIEASRFSESPFSDFLKFFIYYEKLGGMINENQVDTYFDDIVGSYFSDGHKMQTYCAYVMSMKESDMKYRKGYEGTVNCPVDVEIINKKTNEVVGRIVDNVVDEEIFAKENSVVMSVDGDEKTFWLPSNGDYEVRFTGNDIGTMDYTLAEIDSDIGELSRTSFFDVALDDGRTYTSEVGGETFALPDYALTTEDGTEIQPNETFDAENAIEYTVTVLADENGTAGSGGTYTSGDYATVSATPDEGYTFDAWYVDETLVSADAEYRFRVDSDVTLTARFKQTAEPHTHTYTAAVTTEPTCTADGETTYTCECGDTYTEPIPATGNHEDTDNDGYCDTCEEMMQGGQHCKFCGKIHGGLFGWLVKFFHSILAIFKR